jgi:hypothetical protein
MTAMDSEYRATERNYFYLDLSGAAFSPRKAQEDTGLTLHEKLEPATFRTQSRSTIHRLLTAMPCYSLQKVSPFTIRRNGF